MGSVQNSNMPCAACKILRRRCSPVCIFLPHFPPHSPVRFAAVHRVFGASNIGKLLRDIPEDDREDAVTSMVYEAMARLEDPVYGCVGLISSLQKQVLRLQSQLDEAVAEAMFLRTQLPAALPAMASALPYSPGNHDTEENNFNSLYQPDQLQSECNYINSCFNEMPQEALLRDPVLPEPPVDLRSCNKRLPLQAGDGIVESHP